MALLSDILSRVWPGATPAVPRDDPALVNPAPEIHEGEAGVSDDLEDPEEDPDAGFFEDVSFEDDDDEREEETAEPRFSVRPSDHLAQVSSADLRRRYRFIEVIDAQFGVDNSETLDMMARNYATYRAENRMAYYNRGQIEGWRLAGMVMESKLSKLRRNPLLFREGSRRLLFPFHSGGLGRRPGFLAAARSLGIPLGLDIGLDGLEGRAVARDDAIARRPEGRPPENFSHLRQGQAAQPIGRCPFQGIHQL